MPYALPFNRALDPEVTRLRNFQLLTFDFQLLTFFSSHSTFSHTITAEMVFPST